MKHLLIAAAFVAPTALFDAGGGDSTPPTQTNTTTSCAGGQVWSETKGACVNPQSGSLDDDALYGAAREFAYAGQYDNTLAVLAAMSDAQDTRVLTYKGFVHRKMGDVELGNAYYRQAIEADPSNILARSYMGQGYVEAGDIVAARELLIEIRQLGGAGSWAEASLRQAIETGTTYSY
jgi:Flp pilus assembly protein TadD